MSTRARKHSRTGAIQRDRVGERARSRGLAWRGTPPWLVPPALVALTFATFATVGGFEFVRFDDPNYLTKNPYVPSGLTWRGIKWAMTTGYAANWHPLTWLSHMLDVQLFGMNAGAHHLVNVAFHVLNAVLVFTVFYKSTNALGRSAFVAALFAVHPAHVESVAWVSERKDVLSTCWWLVAMLAYVQYARQPSVRRYMLVVMTFALGLLAKPMVVTLPFALLLFDVWPLGRFPLSPAPRRPDAAMTHTTTTRLVLEKVPLIALAAVSGIITVIVQRRWGAVGKLSVYPLELRLENAIVNYTAYVAKLVWPAHLAAFYPYRESVSLSMLVGCGILLVGISAAVARGARRRPYLLVGWSWYLITLAPVIGIVQVGLQSMADRYTYIPFVGLFVIVAWGGLELLEHYVPRRLAAPLAAATVLVACTARAREQVGTWRNSRVLWQHAVEVTPGSAYAQYNLGVVLVQSGHLDDGIARLRDALRIDPNYSDVHIDLGNALNARGDVNGAIAEFATVVRLRPDYPEAHVAYGSLLRARGSSAEAIAQYREALRLDPNLATAHNELGNALIADGRITDALTEYMAAVRLAPDFPEAHNNLGAALARSGDYERASTEFLAALRLKPNETMFHYNAGLMFERLGRTKEALEHLQAVVRNDPNNEAARRAIDRLTGRSGGV